MKLFAIIVAAILTSAAALYGIYDYNRRAEAERRQWGSALESAMASVRLCELREAGHDRTAAIWEANNNLKELIKRAEGRAPLGTFTKAKYFAAGIDNDLEQLMKIKSPRP